MFLGPSGIIEERLLVANTFPYYFGYTTMLVPAPGKYTDAFSYIKALSAQAWLGIFLCWVIVATLMTVFDLASAYIRPRSHLPMTLSTDKVIALFGNYVWTYFRHMLQGTSTSSYGCSWRRRISQFSHVINGSTKIYASVWVCFLVQRIVETCRVSLRGCC